MPVGPFAVLGDALTPREIEVLLLLANGHSIRSSGKELEISPETIKEHAKSIKIKLDAHTNAASVFKACKQQVI